eukprot:2437422-Rhodomonas_salina.1
MHILASQSEKQQKYAVGVGDDFCLAGGRGASSKSTFALPAQRRSSARSTKITSATQWTMPTRCSPCAPP